MNSKLVLGVACAVVGLGLALSGCGNGSDGKGPVKKDTVKTGTAKTGGSDEGFKLPSDPANYMPHKRYEAMKIPENNPITADKAELGWWLFFDTRLSGDESRSCYSCHLNDKGLTDGIPTAIGAYEKKLSRNSPTLWNIGYHAALYWDGRAPTLEKQAAAAWKGGNMGAGKEEGRVGAILKEVNAIKKYKDQFQKAFKSDATEENIPQALASYMRTIISQTTPWDKYVAGDKKAMSKAAVRGWELFNNKEKTTCTNCHSGVLFTDQQFHNIGIGFKDGKLADIGRNKNSKKPEDTGAFKTPTLRDIKDSAPYFHDGSAATLEDALKITLGGGIENPHLDKKNLKKIELSDAEFKDLITFLKEGLDENAPLKMPEVPK